MQPIYSVAIAFCLSTQSFPQDAEIYEWNVAIPGSPAVPADLATDPSNQVVVTGYIDSSIDNQRLVVAKYSSTGNLLWQRGSINRGRSMGMGVASDQAGNSYVLGRFRDTLMLGGMQYVSKGQSDLFLAKYDPDGNIVWSTVIQGGNSGVWPGRISVGRDGNPVFLGSTSDTIVIGKDTLRAPGPQSHVQFLTKMGSDGSVLWTIHSGGTPKHFWMDDLVSKHDDNIVLTGYVTGLGRFGGTPIGAIGPDSADVRPFLVQVSAAGRVVWVKQFEGIRGGRPKGLDRDSQGNIYFSANLSWPGYVIGSDTVRNPSGLSILLVKTDAAGRLLWHRNLAHTGSNYLDGLGVSAEGSVYLKSRFATRVRPDQFMSYSLDSKGVVTNLVSKFDSLGNFEWYSLIPENTTILVVNPMGGLSADKAGNIHVLARKGSQMLLAKIGKDRQSGIQGRFASKWKSFDPKLGKPLYSIDYLKGKFYAGGPNLIIYSGDGSSWKLSEYSSSCSVFGIAYDQKETFLAGATNGITLHSADGVSWQDLGHAPVATIFDMQWDADRFWGVGEYGNIMHSTDGYDWRSGNWVSGQTLYAIAFSDSVGVAVGSQGAIYTTVNRTQWVKQNSGTNQDLYGIAWNGSTFVAVGEAVVTSPDGKTWMLRPEAVPSPSQAFHAVKAIRGQFVAVGENGRIGLSRFGADWKDESFPCGCRLNDIAANDSQIVIVGEDGKILSTSIGGILPASIGGSRDSGPRFQIRRAGGSGLRVGFRLDQDSDIRLTAYDISGRKLGGFTGRIGKGTHSRDIRIGAAHTGLCLVELVTGHGSLVEKALIR